MSRRDAVEQRVHLARSNLDLVGVALGTATARGADLGGLCVLLMDTRDPIARALTAAIVERFSDLDLGAEEARAVARDLIPTGLAVVELRAVEALLGESHPTVAGAVRREPRLGTVRVIVVAAGGASLMHVPVEPVVAKGYA